MVAKIATGQESDVMKDPHEAKRIGGKNGGLAARKNLSEDERKQRAMNAAKARWNKKRR